MATTAIKLLQNCSWCIAKKDGEKKNNSNNTRNTVVNRGGLITL